MTVRATHAYAVQCDGVNCLNSHGELYYAESDALEDVNNSDWATDGVLHWCPPCQGKPHDCAPDPEDLQGCARCGMPIGDGVAGGEGS